MGIQGSPSRNCQGSESVFAQSNMRRILKFLCAPSFFSSAQFLLFLLFHCARKEERASMIRNMCSYDNKKEQNFIGGCAAPQGRTLSDLRHGDLGQKVNTA